MSEESAPPPPRRITWLAALPLAVLVLFLLAGPKPWEDGVAAARADGRTPKPEHYGVTGMWFGALAALPAAAVLLGLRRRLATPLPDDGKRFLPRLPSGQWLLFGLVAAGTLGTAAVLHAPRLQQSFWDDEDKAMRYFTVGRYKQQDDGSLRFLAADWSDVFFNYRQPNNHILFSILSKASHDALAPPRDTAGRPYFDEASLRLPAFVAGLGAIVGVGLLLCSLGFQRAALWAMPLLALHPWFLRYLVEARGYSLVLCLSPLVLATAARATDSGRLRWWGAFALCQFLLFYTFPGSLHFLAWTHLAVMGVILTTRRGGSWKTTQLARWIGAGCLSGIFICVMMGPCLPQFLDFLAEERDNPHVTATTWKNLGALLASGTTWKSWDPSNPLSMGLLDLLDRTWWGWAVASVLGAFFFAGIVRLAIKSRLHATFLLVFLLPALTFPLHAMLGETVFYPWYAIGSLPFVVALAALGADWPTRPLGRGRLATHVTLVAGVASLLLFAVFTAPQRDVITSHPIEPKRESAAAMRAPHLNPVEPEQDQVITVGFHQENLAYDPRLRRLNDTGDKEGLKRVMAEAREKGLPLYVDFGQEAYARQHFIHIFPLLDDPRLFRVVAEFPGLEAQNTRKVMQFVPTPREAGKAAQGDTP